MSPSSHHPSCLDSPQVSLLGELFEPMVERFLEQLAEAEKGDGDIAVELTTPGGDAELARRLVLEVERARSRLGSRRLLLLGKTQLYSAGITLMSAFPVCDRYLTRDTVLLVHGRQLDERFEIQGPMRANLPRVKALLAQFEIGIRHEEENFRRLIEGSDVSFEQICQKAIHNWYFTAQEALDRKLVAGLV